MSVMCHFLSIPLATTLLMSGGAIPASMYRLLCLFISGSL